MTNIKDLDVDAKDELKKIIIDNKQLGGSGWKGYTYEELSDLGLGYLIEGENDVRYK